jgi:phage shock protein PspC (stress-responsive transcriptional regulator)
MSRRLYRSTTDKKIAGVCGGLGEYFDIDPTLIRILWLILVLFAGTGLLAYIICWIVIPEKSAASQTPSPTEESKPGS